MSIYIKRMTTNHEEKGSTTICLGNVIQVTVVNPEHIEVDFYMVNDLPMKHLFNRFCEIEAKRMTEEECNAIKWVEFYWNQKPIPGANTPREIGIKNGTSINTINIYHKQG